MEQQSVAHHCASYPAIRIILVDQDRTVLERHEPVGQMDCDGAPFDRGEQRQRNGPRQKVEEPAPHAARCQSHAEKSSPAGPTSGSGW